VTPQTTFPRSLAGNEWAFLLLCSDGVTDSISDQEIVDLCRGIKDPERAAKKVVSFAEDVGACVDRSLSSPRSRRSRRRLTLSSATFSSSSSLALYRPSTCRPRPAPPPASVHLLRLARPLRLALALPNLLSTPHTPSLPHLAPASNRITSRRLYSEDNLTCVVVPLAGWGKLGGLDSTASRREYRLKGGGIGSGRQKRM